MLFVAYQLIWSHSFSVDEIYEYSEKSNGITASHIIPNNKLFIWHRVGVPRNSVIGFVYLLYKSKGFSDMHFIFK